MHRKIDFRLGTRYALLFLLLFSAVALMPPALAQTAAETPSPADSSTAEVTDAQTTDALTSDVEQFSDTAADDCNPPTTQEKLMILVGFIAIFSLCFYLLVRLMERRFISQDRSARLGRHVGISLTILLSSAGLVVIASLITRCFQSQFLIWFAYAGVLFIIHLFYVLVTVRRT